MRALAARALTTRWFPDIVWIVVFDEVLATGRVRHGRFSRAAVAAYPDDDARARALNDPVVCYLRKPVDEKHLMRCSAALHSDEPRKRNS